MYAEFSKMYIYACIYIFVYLLKYANIVIYIYIFKLFFKKVYIYYLYTNDCININIYICMHKKDIYIYICIKTNIYIYIYMYANIYIYTYKHMYA